MAKNQQANKNEKANQSSSSVNKQIIDSIKAMNTLLKDGGDDSLHAMGQQVLTQAASIAMLNMVNQQQQLYILQNTATTVAVKSMLESKPDEAMKIMNASLSNINILGNLKEFSELMSEIVKEP